MANIRPTACSSTRTEAAIRFTAVNPYLLVGIVTIIGGLSALVACRRLRSASEQLPPGLVDPGWFNHPPVDNGRSTWSNQSNSRRPSRRAQYEDAGYLVFPELLDAVELAQLRAALAEVLQEAEGLTESNDKFSVVPT